jgi:adenylate cyclase
MKRSLEVQAEKYYTKFGLVPGFKAGLHYGMVTVGEIGSLKKEIIFTGDVFLVSEDLVKILNLPGIYAVTSVGETILKGRSKAMELFSISISME